MNSVTVSISAASIPSNTQTTLPALNFKGRTELELDVTGVQEQSHVVSNLSIEWGDGTNVEYYSKDLIVDYKTTSIFNELLYGKLDGSIAGKYYHTYNMLVDQSTVVYDMIVILTYENGYTHEFTTNITVYPESFYDSLKDLKLLTTQISPTFKNSTVANIETESGSTFISILDVTPTIFSGVPVNLNAPRIIGNPWNGMLLSASPGAWTNQPYQYSYQWKVNGVSVPGQFYPTWIAYDIFDGDIIDVDVSAISEDGQSEAEDSNNLIGIEAPYSITIPQLSGIPISNEILYSSFGTFGGSISVKSIQWEKNGGDISGATLSSFAINSISSVHGDVIRTRVTATNLAGSSIVYSLSTSIVYKPVYVAGGSVNGSAAPGAPIFASDPLWYNIPNTPIREWYKNGIATGVSAISYSDTVGGDTITAMFSAYNIAGTSSGVMSVNSVTIQYPPAILTIPIITGGNYVGGTLYTSDGTWDYGPTEFTYQWYLNSVALSGQTNSSLDVGEVNAVYSDVIGVEVTAYNDGGNTTSAAADVLVSVSPIYEYGSVWYTQSAVQGLNELVQQLSLSSTETGSVWYTQSAVRGLLRNSVVLSPLSPEYAGSIWYTQSAVQGLNRFSEVLAPSISEFGGSVWYTQSAVRGRLV